MVREALLTLNANVVVACERAGYDSATVKMIEDALDTIEDALQAGEPRVMTLEEVKALQPDTDIWIEVRYLNAPIRIRACTVSGFSPGGTRLFIIGGAHNYPMDMYNNYFRCWTSRPTDKQRKEVAWNE